ncbi:MAG: M56 family metallopeptidase [Actinomycetota bacterium]|jgi:hypothetical protein
MAVVLLLGGLCLLILPFVIRRPGRRLAPAEWVRLSAGLLGGGAVVFELALALIALPTVARAAGLHELAHVCERILGIKAAGTGPAGWAAATAAVGLPLLAFRGAVRAWRTQRRFRIEPELGRHEPYGRYELVVLPTDALLALSVSGRPGQIVLSQGLVDVVSPAELGAVVRHEAAHLAHGHHRVLILAAAVEASLGRLPLVRRSVRALRTGLERWADEDAAGGHQTGRSTVRNALVGVALAVVDPAVAAFGGVDGVVERLDALQAPTPNPTIFRRIAIYTPVIIVAAAILVAVGVWLGHTRAMLLLGSPCSS